MNPRLLSALAILTVLTGCGGSAAPSAPASASAAATKPALAPSSPAEKPSSSPAASAKPSAPASASASAAAGGNVIRSAWVALTTGQAPSWMAADGGYFQKYGLNVELTYIEGSAKTTAAMIGGSVENAEMAGEATVVAQTKGASDLVILAGFNNQSPFKLMTWDDKVTSLADLKGRTIATSQGGSADEFILNKLLKANNMTPKDINVTYMQGGDPARITALKAHQIDAAMSSVPWDRVAVKQGLKIVVDTIPMNLPHPQNTFVTTRSYLKAHRDETLNFLKAEAEGIHRFKKDKPFVLQTIKKYLKTDDQDYLEGAYESFSILMPDDLHLDPAAIQAVLDQNNITGRKPEEFYDPSLVNELKSSGFLTSLN
jgi:NitT/TauT family transport system substrate-binding protein